MPRPVTAFALLVFCSAILSGCGGGGGGGVGDPTISLFQPTVLYSNGESQIRVLGRGFGARKSKVTVRFDAESGTPFQNGTSATFETLCTVDSDSQVRGTAPASFANTDVQAFVTVVLADGTEIPSDGTVATIVEQQLTSMTPDSISSGSMLPFTISGVGFQPPLGLVNIRFNAVSGTPFLAGASNFVATIGTVETNSTITGIFPDGMVSEDCDATVTVILPDGATITSTAPLVHWIPVPTVSSFSPGAVPSGVPVPFIVTGTAYTPAGANATITFEAVSGTPFFGGTSATWSFQGTVDDATQISGVMPPMSVTSTGLAYVRVTLGGGVTAVGATPFVQYLPPPDVTAIAPTDYQSGSPTPWEVTGVTSAFTITGTNFGSPGTPVNVTFTASSGTPFNNGTSASFVAAGSVVSTTTISGTFADPVADTDASGSIAVAWPTGVTDTLGPNAWTMTVAPPVTLPTWSTSAASGTISASDDSTTSVSFAAGFQFPLYGVSYTSGYANSNGSMSFGSGDTSFSPNTATLQSGPRRLCINWTDLNPSGGYLTWNTSAHSDRGVLTWNNSPYYSQGNINLQLHAYYTGRVDYCYGWMNDPNNRVHLVGIGGNGATLTPVDWSAVVFDDKASFTTSSTPYEQSNGPHDLRGTNSGNLTSGGWILFYPNSNGGYDWASGS